VTSATITPGANAERSKAQRSLTVAFVLALIGCVTLTLIPALVSLVLCRRAERRLAESGELAEELGRVATVRKAANLGVYLGVIGALFLFWYITQDGLADVQRTLFNGQHLVDSFPTVIEGFWLNIQIFVVAEILVLPWGLALALMRTTPGRAATPLRWFAIAYVDLFRGLPAIVTIYLVGFGLPQALPALFNDNPVNEFLFGSRQISLFQLGVIALTLVYGAYVAEVFRSGMESVHWSQTAAARSLGLEHGQTQRYVVVPQAVRRVVPPLLNDFIGLQKDTALVSVIGALEGFNRARIYAGNKFNLSSVVGLGLCFVVITIPMTRFTDWLVERDQRRMRANG
jgi:polar amino acid transport system permease protein